MKCLWNWEPERRFIFFVIPPAYLHAVKYITEISLHVTLSNQSHLTDWDVSIVIYIFSICIAGITSNVFEFIATKCPHWPYHIRKDGASSRARLRGMLEKLCFQRNQRSKCQTNTGMLYTELHSYISHKNKGTLKNINKLLQLNMALFSAIRKACIAFA